MAVEIGSNNKIEGVNAIGANAQATGSVVPKPEPSPPTPLWKRTWFIVAGLIAFLAGVAGLLSDGWQVADRISPLLGSTATEEADPTP